MNRLTAATCARVVLQDCCPRDPFWNIQTRYTGLLDAALTRPVCTQESILLNESSPCLSSNTSASLDIDQMLDNAGLTKGFTTTMVVLIMLAMSLSVAWIMVPLIVYSQLVYSGFWPLLNWRQRMWCLLTGNYLAIKTGAMKAVTHREMTRRTSRTSVKLELTGEDDREDARGCSSGVATLGRNITDNSWCHLTRSWGQHVYHPLGSRWKARGSYEGCTRVAENAEALSLALKEKLTTKLAAKRLVKPSERLAYAKKACIKFTHSELNALRVHGLQYDSFVEVTFTPTVTLYFQQAAGRKQTPLMTWCVFAPFILPFVCILNVIRWEFVFDIIPLRCDTRMARKCLKSLRLIAALYVLGFLLTWVPSRSTSGIHDTLECVLESCQSAGWRTSIESFACESAQSVGLIQPCFWSDLVDIVEAALTLAVLTLIAEWRDTVQGKNDVGLDLLKKVDQEVEQDFVAFDPEEGQWVDDRYDRRTQAWMHDKLPNRLPKVAPEYAKVLPYKKRAQLEQSMERLLLLKEEEEDLTPAARQARRVTAVNTAASGTKLTMAQLYSALGSIAAIIGGARAYHSQCVSNVLLWENTTNPEIAIGAWEWRSISSLVAFLFNTIETNDESLSLLLMKPERQPLITWTMIFRATMSNLTLVTIGIAVKNFITRTSTAKSAVACMIAQRDASEADNEVVTILLHAVGSGFGAIQKMARSGFNAAAAALPCLKKSRALGNAAKEATDEDDDEEDEPSIDEEVRAFLTNAVLLLRYCAQPA